MNKFIVCFLFFNFLFQIKSKINNIDDKTDIIFELLQNDDNIRNKRDIYVLEESKRSDINKKLENSLNNKDKKQEIADTGGLDSDNLQNYAINTNNDINYDSASSYGSFNLADALDDNQNSEILASNDIDTSKSDESAVFETGSVVDEEIIQPTYYHHLKSDESQNQNTEFVQSQEELDNSHSLMNSNSENVNHVSQGLLTSNKISGSGGMSSSNIVLGSGNNQGLSGMTVSQKAVESALKNPKYLNHALNAQSVISQFSNYPQKNRKIGANQYMFKQMNAHNGKNNGRYKPYLVGNQKYTDQSNNLLINPQPNPHPKPMPLKEPPAETVYISPSNNPKIIQTEVVNTDENSNGYDETVVEVVLDCSSCGDACPESCTNNPNYINISNFNIINHHCCANNMIENVKKCPPCAFIDTSNCPAAASEFDKFNEMYFILEVGLREPYKPEMVDKNSESFQKIRKICQDFILRVYHDHPYYHETIVNNIKNSKDYSIASMLIRFTKLNNGNISPLYKAIMCKCGCDIFYIDLFFKLQPANTSDITPFCPAYCFSNTASECNSNNDCMGCCSNAGPMSFFLQKVPNIPSMMPTIPMMNMGMFNPLISHALCPNNCHDSCYPFCSEECCLNSQGFKRTLRSKIETPSEDDV